MRCNVRELFSKIIQVLLILLSALGGTISLVNASSAPTTIGKVVAIICGAFMLMGSGMLIMLQILYMEEDNDEK